MIGRAEAEAPDLAVVADMEAGLEHLSWAGGTLRHVDLLLIVAEPTAKSLLTAARTQELATQLGIPRMGLVGNRVTPECREVLEQFASERGLELWALLPDDPQVRRADRMGVCPVDATPGAPAVRAVADLAAQLDARFPGPARGEPAGAASDSGDGDG